MNVYPNQMVASFEDWCYDENRATGDTGIIESDYGYHVMYFVDNSNMTYRDFQIQQDLMNEDVTNWYNSLLEATTVVDGNTEYVNTGLVLSSN